MPYGLTLSGRYPAFGAEAAHLVPGAPDSINRLRFYLPPFVRRRSHELPFSCWKRAAYIARYFRVGLARQQKGGSNESGGGNLSYDPL